MKRLIALSLLAVLISACTPAKTFTMHNRQNLMRLGHGMTKEQVNAVMGTESSRTYNNPYRSAMYLGKDDKPVEVHYYWTDYRGREVRDDALTPVIFNDSKLVGWGREFWTEFVTKYEIRVKTD